MGRKTKHLLASTALAVFMLHAQPSFGETVTQTTPGAAGVRTTVTTRAPTTTRTETRWKTEERTVAGIDSRSINFADFDINKDSVLSINEIGKMLFELYDTDGNDVIDNIEYERRAVVTILPIEKDTVISYDFNGDGRVDKTRYTYETFLQDTLLTRFDKNRDGLSPHEFMEAGFLSADVNDDKVIDLKEWQGSYMPAVDKSNKEKSRFNK